MMTDKATVTMSAQAGDLPCYEATQPHFGPLRNLLEEHRRGPYSTEVDEFELVLRIDGDIDHWEQEGSDRMRRSKKERYITIDIYVPRKRWEGVSGLEIRRYLAACTEEALHKMIGKLRRDKVAVDGDALLRDFATLKERFLDQNEALAAS